MDRGYKLLCNQEPVYGGSGNKALNGTKFDEVSDAPAPRRPRPPLLPAAAAAAHSMRPPGTPGRTAARKTWRPALSRAQLSPAA